MTDISRRIIAPNLAQDWHGIDDAGWLPQVIRKQIKETLRDDLWRAFDRRLVPRPCSVAAKPPDRRRRLRSAGTHRGAFVGGSCVPGAAVGVCERCSEAGGGRLVAEAAVVMRRKEEA